MRDSCAWLVRHKERIGLVAVGHTGKKIEEFIFDWLLYGAVSAHFTATYGTDWGSLATFAVMAPFSAVMCLIYIRLYDWAKLDLFGFEAVKALADLNASTGWFARLLRGIVRMGDIPAFFALCIFEDPFMATVYLRKGSKYDGLTGRDRIIFLASVLFSNAYWTLQWTAIIMLGRFLLKLAT